MDISLGIWRLVDYGANILKTKAVNASNAEITEYLRKCICEFQVEYTNYQFLASRLHRDFKETFLTNTEASHELYTQLETFVEKGLKKLRGDQAEYIRNYFDLTHSPSEKPRVGIHAVNDEDDVVDIIMLPSGEIGTKKKIEEYSVFREVVDTGLPYLNNNLPRTAKKNDEFVHKGLDIEAIRRGYRRKIRDLKLISRWRNNLFKKSLNDPEWAQLSKNGNAKKNTLYKSHLVVPITFRGHAEKGRLDSSMVDILQLREDGRSILGFVCVDHPSTYFFDDKNSDSYDNIDINMLYMYADMISLIFVTALMYTIGSETCDNYLLNFGEHRDGENVLAPL